MNITHAIVGNLAARPELQHTPKGVPVTRVRVASNPVTRRADGTLVKHEPVFHDVQLWRELAQRFSELESGAAVVLVGEFRSSTYTTAEGQRRTRTYLHATAGGPDLSFMEVSGVARAHRRSDEPETPQAAGEAAAEAEDMFDIDSALG